MDNALKELYKCMLRDNAEVDEIEERNSVYFVHLKIPWGLMKKNIKFKTMVILKPCNIQ